MRWRLILAITLLVPAAAFAQGNVPGELLVIHTVCMDLKTAQQNKEMGTGFFITTDGYALTSRHNLECEAGLERGEVTATIGSPTNQPAKSIEVLFEGRGDNEDIALIQVRDLTSDVPIIPICSIKALDVGTTLHVRGFPPKAKEASSTKYTVSATQAGRWMVTGFTSRGMSGSAVRLDGRAVAVLMGEYENSAHLRVRVTPLHVVESQLENYIALPQCGEEAALPKGKPGVAKMPLEVWLRTTCKTEDLWIAHEAGGRISGPHPLTYKAKYSTDPTGTFDTLYLGQEYVQATAYLTEEGRPVRTLKSLAYFAALDPKNGRNLLIKSLPAPGTRDFEIIRTKEDVTEGSASSTYFDGDAHGTIFSAGSRHETNAVVGAANDATPAKEGQPMSAIGKELDADAAPSVMGQPAPSSGVDLGDGMALDTNIFSTGEMTADFTFLAVPLTSRTINGSVVLTGDLVCEDE